MQEKFEFIKRPTDVLKCFMPEKGEALSLGETEEYDEICFWDSNDAKSDNMNFYNRDEKPLELLLRDNKRNIMTWLEIYNDFEVNNKRATELLRVKLAKQNGKPYIDGLRAHLYAKAAETVEQVERLSQEEQ